MQGVYQEFRQPMTDGPPGDAPRSPRRGGFAAPSAFLIVHCDEKGRLTPRYLSLGRCQAAPTRPRKTARTRRCARGALAWARQYQAREPEPPLPLAPLAQQPRGNPDIGPRNGYVAHHDGTGADHATGAYVDIVADHRANAHPRPTADADGPRRVGTHGNVRVVGDGESLSPQSSTIQ